MRVLGDREDELAGPDRLVLEPLARLVHVPAEVLEPRAHARQIVDLLQLVLADVADVEVAGAAVEREPPRVAEAECLDPDSLGRDVHREKLPEEGAHVLRAVLRIAAGAAVADREVEPAVRAEGQLAAVVVPYGSSLKKSWRALPGSAVPARARYSTSRVSPPRSVYWT